MVYRSACTEVALHNSLEHSVAVLIETVIYQRPMKKEHGSEIRPLASPRQKYALCLGDAGHCYRHAPGQLRRAYYVIAGVPVVLLIVFAALKRQPLDNGSVAQVVLGYPNYSCACGQRPRDRRCPWV